MVNRRQRHRCTAARLFASWLAAVVACQLAASCDSSSGHARAAHEAKESHEGHDHDDPAGHDHAHGSDPGAQGGAAPGTTIVFKGDDHEALIGVETVAAKSAQVGQTIEATGRIAYDQDRMADVRSLVPGLVSEVHAVLGATVEKDAVLFVLESAEVGREQGEARGARQRVATAKAHRDRQRQLHASGVISARQLELAEQELAQAQAELAGVRKSLDASGASAAGQVVLRAPLAGTIVSRPGGLGTLAASDVSLATIVDTSRMWAMLDVPEDSASSVAVGQKVSVRIDGLRGPRSEGEVSWISPAVDPRTRTVTVRVELENASGLLRANQFARARIEVGAPQSAVVVPRDAIQRVGEESVVFVRIAQGVYEPRPVMVGLASADGVAVTGELAPGEHVVTTGAFTLKTELSPEAIGAGCCEAH